MDDLLDISDIDEAMVLAELYNYAQPKGLGFLHFDPQPMTTEEAIVILEQQRRFDYLKGRVMKVGFFDARRPVDGSNQPGKIAGARWYDRDNGEGSAERVIAALRGKSKVAQ